MQWVTDAEIVEGYLTDASNIRGEADAVVRPRSTDEVVELVNRCREQGVAITVSAGRTSTTAAAVPHGGVVLSMEALNQVLSIEEHTARAQGGVYLGAFQEEIERSGRFFPPDPTSRHECTLGAAISTNASGARSFRYGPIRPWVLGLTVVLPSGQVLKIKRGDVIPAHWPRLHWKPPSVKTSAGYSESLELIDLFIGQEGTLGIITEATVRLTALPEEVVGLLCWFSSRQDAHRFACFLRDSARTDPRSLLSPRCIEYLDHHCLSLAREQVDHVPDRARAVLFCEQECTQGVDEHLEAWFEALESYGALVDDTVAATDEVSQRALLSLRHAVPAGVNETVIRNGMRKVGTDLSVPDEAMEAMFEAYEAAPLKHVLFGHLGDNHLHLNLLPESPAQLDEAKAYYDELAKKAISLGGSVSAEHGIGKLKHHQLQWMVGEEVIEQFRTLKRYLDPQGVLGVGNIF